MIGLGLDRILPCPDHPRSRASFLLCGCDCLDSLHLGRGLFVRQLCIALRLASSFRHLFRHPLSPWSTVSFGVRGRSRPLVASYPRLGHAHPALANSGTPERMANWVLFNAARFADGLEGKAETLVDCWDR